MYLPTSALSRLDPYNSFPEPDGQILSLQWPAEGELARRVVYRARSRVTWLYASWKMDRMVECESFNERCACVLLDACSEVRAYREQPVTIKYLLNGVKCFHVPDILAEFADRNELWEVKPLADAMEDDFVERSRVMATELPKFGYHYRVVIGEDVRQEDRLKVARILIRYGRTNPDILVREKVRVALTEAPFVTWGTASDGYFGSNGRHALARLTLEGKLGCDANDRLTRHTQFYPRN